MALLRSKCQLELHGMSGNQMPIQHRQQICDWPVTGRHRASIWQEYFPFHDESGNSCLNKSHVYFAKVQGEMNILEFDWCDFVVFSGGVVHVDRIFLTMTYYRQSKLLPALEYFFVECVLKEIIGGEIFGIVSLCSCLSFWCHFCLPICQ